VNTLTDSNFKRVGEDDAREFYASGLACVSLLEQVVVKSEKGATKGGGPV
jgi:hypothetical protein